LLDSLLQEIAGLQGNGRDKMFRMVELLLLLPRTVSIRTLKQ